MYFRKKTSGGRAYLPILERRRDGAQVRQQVIATLGRYDDLRESGQLERLLRSGARFSTKAMVVDAVHDGSAAVSEVRRLGPALVFERLWETTGCRAAIEELAGERKHEFALERAVFLTVLHRLFAGGSDRAADRWREDYRIDGVEGLDLHHLYRAMAWLGEELPADQQDGRTLAPRCLKDDGRAAVRQAARPVQQARPRVHGHDQPVLRRCWWADAGPSWVLQGPSARPASDDPRRPARRKRPAGLHRDVAGQHR